MKGIRQQVWSRVWLQTQERVGEDFCSTWDLVWERVEIPVREAVEQSVWDPTLAYVHWEQDGS